MRIVSPDVALGLGPKWREMEIIGGPQVDGNMGEDEEKMIAALTRFVDPKIVMEMGTLNGRTTLNLAKFSSPRCRVYTIDIQKCGERIQEQLEYRGQIIQLLGDTTDFDFTPFYGKCELVLVDAGHDYIQTLMDSLIAMKLLSSSGVVIWHDYHPHHPQNEVWKALEFFAIYYPGLSPVWVEGSGFIIHGQGSLRCLSQ